MALALLSLAIRARHQLNNVDHRMSGKVRELACKTEKSNDTGRSRTPQFQLRYVST